MSHNDLHVTCPSRFAGFFHAIQFIYVQGRDVGADDVVPNIDGDDRQNAPFQLQELCVCVAKIKISDLNQSDCFSKTDE